MGIGATMKNMFKDENAVNEQDDRVNDHSFQRNDANYDRTSTSARGDGDINLDSGLASDSGRHNSKRASYKLGAGTGPGTLGKQGAAQQDLGRSRTGQGAEDYGTAKGTHHVPGRTAGYSSGAGVQSNGIAANGLANPSDTGADYGQAKGVRSVNNADPDSDLSQSRSHGVVGRSGTLDDSHRFGHGRHNDRDVMPTGNAQEITNQLNPVTHERVRHIETEEVTRVKDHERHIHHVQHHTQPVIAAEELPELHHEHVHPVTRIQEKHVNKIEDTNLFDGQVRQHRDTLDHAAKERIIIDKGTTVNQQTHHHVHHVIQPVIQKETIDRRRIHTVIPIHEVTHEAPVVHQSQTHAPVPIEHFLSRGGSLSGAVTHDQIGHTVLHKGQCMREVDGVADDLARDLNLRDAGAHTHTHTGNGNPVRGSEFGTGHEHINDAQDVNSTNNAVSVSSA